MTPVPHPTRFPELSIPQSLAGLRLADALRQLLPQMGVRGRRRLWREHQIFRNGRPASANAIVRSGDSIRIETAPSPETGRSEPRVLLVGEKLAALDKPSGLHSQHLAGGSQPSLEDLLPALLGGQVGEWRLLNRLDRDTSGIVLAGNSVAVAAAFREEENRGAARKTYYALVHGRVSEAMLLTAELHVARTKKTLIRADDGLDPLRYTRIVPIRPVRPEDLPACLHLPESAPGEEYHLVLCQIQKGRRHQIRAHLAHAGHPIAGDALYGNAPAGCRLFLHHAHIDCLGFTVSCPPPWSEMLQP